MPKVSVTPRPVLHKRAQGVRPNLRLDVNLVLVPVSVTDRLDRPVTDLSAASFRLFEDDIEQQIVSFFREDGPVSVGFIFDTSSSMKKRMDRSVAAIHQFLETLTPGDEFFLIQFSDAPSLVTGFTRNPDDILQSLSKAEPHGWTALNDAILLGAQRMKSARNPRRALFVLTDGEDNNSRYSDSEVRDLVRESNLRVYSIGLFARPQFLERLAADTGARAFWAHKVEELPDAVDRLSREFRHQYVLGYSSKNEQKDGKYRRVKVELTDARDVPLNLFWRRGYYAPPD